ncbi:unnamed protein product [Calicophoron daubneyi]|uniref:Uncharacterized protein n=1 Tax=Calicophoron daubneyi TaxID=300641 RepID=A0AAV2TW27_CALDB
MQFGSNLTNGFTPGRLYGSIGSTPVSPYASASSLKPIRSPTSYSHFGGTSYALGASSPYRTSSAAGDHDRSLHSRRSSVDRSGTEYTSSLSSFPSSRYSSSTTSSRDSSSGRYTDGSSKPQIGYARSNSHNVTSHVVHEEEEEPNEEDTVPEKYFVATSRGCSTEEDAEMKNVIAGISSTKTQKMERTNPRIIQNTNGTQTADDILLPSTKGNSGSPTNSKMSLPRRLNIGGRYLNQLSRTENETQNATPYGRGGWREAVYGVDYSAKSRAQTQPPTSPKPSQNTSEAEQRKLEREKMMEEEWKNQIKLEIEREHRRLRQLERKAKWEKDEIKNQELEEEIRRRKQVAADLAAKEASMKAAEEKRKRELSEKAIPHSSAVNDPIQKVNDWKRQNSLHRADPPSAGEMTSSQLWDVVEKPEETSPVRLRENDQTKRPYIRKSEVSRYSRDSEATIRQDTLTSDSKLNGGTPNVDLRRRSSAATNASNSYVTEHTDIDDLLKNKFPARSNKTVNGISGPVKSPSSRKDYYADAAGDSDEEEVKLVYKSWKAKELFQRMTIELQNLIMKSHKHPISVRMVMDVCRNKYHDRRFTDAEEQNFQGYKSANELLTESGVDVKKVSQVQMLY